MAHPEFIPVIKKHEDEINARETMYVPMDKLVNAYVKCIENPITGKVIRIY